MMTTVPIESRKKDSFIQIGTTRRRIADDHHAALTRLKEDFRYLTMEQLLMWTSFIGAMIVLNFNPFTLIPVENRADRRGAAR